MTPLEQLIASVIHQHPEYHRLVEKGESSAARDYLPEGGETNPYLHMGMHISLREQFGSDRPPGIARLYRQLLTKLGDPHETEHRMMECLGRTLWEAQREGTMPNVQAYLECLRVLCRN